jgi:hypothetical protein
MGRLLEIAKAALTETAARSPQVAEPSSADQLPVSDPYAERMRAALSSINAADYPGGMVPWLGTAQPSLYAELTSHLPDDIVRMWSERAPLDRFEAVLARLVSVHRRCCELYRAQSSR